MQEERRALAQWVYDDLDQNPYLHKLYNKLLLIYTYVLQGKTDETLTEKESAHLLRFADLLSKSIDNEKEAFHHNIAQNIVSIIEKILPLDDINQVYMGSVLTNVNNYVGLSGKAPDYQNPDLIERLVELVHMEDHRLPEVCGTDMYFDASQNVAYDRLKSKDYYSFSGPTSMGKTFLVKTFILERVKNNYWDNYVIVVPSRALINEVKSEIIITLGNNLEEKKYKVITAPTATMNLDDYRYIMIFTQERLAYSLKLNPKMEINYLFVDEAQKISEVGLRSTFFYKVINELVNSNKEMKLFFLCPYVPNPGVYLNLIPGKNNKRNQADVFEFSPVNQHKSIVDISSKTMKTYNDLTKTFIKTTLVDMNVTDTISFLSSIGNDCSNIVFCDSKTKVEELAIKYWITVKEDMTPEIRDLIKDVEREIHPRSFLVIFLKKRICCHVGYLPATIKLKIEELFRKKIIKTIFCTSTLLEGVNLPADNLLITFRESAYILKNSTNFKNLMGRVGRKTYNLIGNVYVIPDIDSNATVFEHCEELIKNPIEQQELSVDKLLDDKLKRKIVKNLTEGTATIEKGDMNFEKLNMSRFVLNILLKSILNQDYSNYIYKQFEDFLSQETRQQIVDNFKGQSVNDDSNVTVDQIQRLDQEILFGRLDYPDVIEYNNVLSFLQKLYEVFNWKKYEPKTDIGKLEKLSYYAVILNQWMQGHSVRRIIDKALEHTRQKGEIYDLKEKRSVKYEGKASQDNRLVIETLTSIEDIVLFKISNYFTKFSERYKVMKQLESIENDWAEYIDFGSSDDLLIELQKVGFSREVAKNIKKSELAYLEEGKLRLQRRLMENMEDELTKEVEEVRLNFSELFVN